MPTCRSCGRVGGNPCEKCAATAPKPSSALATVMENVVVSRAMRPQVEYAHAIVTTARARHPPIPRASKSPPQRKTAQNEIGTLVKNYGDLLLTEDSYRGDPTNPGARERKAAMQAARQRHASELRALRENVENTVQAEAYWRKSGIRPGHFSRMGLSHTPAASDAAPDHTKQQQNAGTARQGAGRGGSARAAGCARRCR